MAARNEIILSNQTHPDGSTVESLFGDKFKGDGYYGRSDGIHTVQWSLSNFVGSVKIQGSLSVDPQEDDWFTVRLETSNEFVVDTTGKVSTLLLNSLNYVESTSNSFTYNFVGNYVWVRARIENWTAGTVNSIILSH
jgi:hypothetical protein